MLNCWSVFKENDKGKLTIRFTSDCRRWTRSDFYLLCSCVFSQTGEPYLDRQACCSSIHQTLQNQLYLTSLDRKAKATCGQKRHIFLSLVRPAFKWETLFHMETPVPFHPLLLSSTVVRNNMQNTQIVILFYLSVERAALISQKTDHLYSNYSLGWP